MGLRDDIANAKKDNDYGFILGQLLRHGQIVWQTHLAAPDDSYATHEALGNYYSFLTAHVDGLIEAVFGKYGKLDISFTDVTAFDRSDTSSIAEGMGAWYVRISDWRDNFQEGWIQSEFDLILKELSATIYKLRFLS